MDFDLQRRGATDGWTRGGMAAEISFLLPRLQLTSFNDSFKPSGCNWLAVH